MAERSISNSVIVVMRVKTAQLNARASESGLKILVFVGACCTVCSELLIINRPEFCLYGERVGLIYRLIKTQAAAIW